MPEETQFERDARRAREKFQITEAGGNRKGVYLNAEAGTGSRYAVVIAPLPGSAWNKEGGRHLISLLQPWQANMVFTVDGGEIHGDYVVEKLMKDRRHGGDVAAVVLAVNMAARMMFRAEDGERRLLDDLMGVKP